MSKFNIIIPARMRSSRLANKMLLDVEGIPLCIRVAKQAHKTDANIVIVATDHIDILNACKNYGVEAIMTSIDHQSGTDRLAEVVKKLNWNLNEIVINVQGDEPLIDPNLINQLGEFITRKKTPIATIAHAIHDKEEIFNPNVVKTVLDKDENALYFSRASIPFYREGFTNDDNFKIPADLNILRHIGIYAYTVKFLHEYGDLPRCNLEHVECLEQLRALYNGYKIAVMTSDSIPATGVDTLEDLHKVKQIIKNEGIK